MQNVLRKNLFKVLITTFLSTAVTACSLDASIVGKNDLTLPKDINELPNNGGVQPGHGGNSSPPLNSPTNSESDVDGSETVQVPSGGGYEIKAIIGHGTGVIVIQNSYTIEGSFQ